MGFLVLFATITLAVHASRTAERVVRAGTGSEGDLVGWISGLAVWFVLAGLATQYEGNVLLLAGIAVGTEVVLLATDASIRKFFPLPGAGQVQIESDDGEDSEDGTETDDDYSDDDDFQEASKTADQLAEVFAGTDWSEAKQFVDHMIDEELPRLIELRDGLGENIERTVDRLDNLDRTKRNEGRRKNLQTNRDSLRALRQKIDAGIAETVSTLDKLLVIGRERQVNGATDATDRAVKLLTETHKNNEILLATQREVDQLESP